MKTMTIKRITENQDGLFGVLLDGNIQFALTVERNWLNNQPNISCIPIGQYKCVRVKSKRFGITFEITGVPNRSNILFHWGNVKTDSEGCIIIGEKYSELNGVNAVLESKNTPEGFNEFMRRLQGVNEFMLNIERHY